MKKFGAIGIASLLLVLAAPVLAGEHATIYTGGKDDGFQSGTSTPQGMNVYLYDADTGARITSGSGAIYTISHQGEAPTCLATATAGLDGVLYFRLTARAGDYYNCVVNAPYYNFTTVLVRVGKSNTTWCEADLAATPIGDSKGGNPQSAPTQVATTWGRIKALY